jgi:hypothetical protein
VTNKNSSTPSLPRRILAAAENTDPLMTAPLLKADHYLRDRLWTAAPSWAVGASALIQRARKARQQRRKGSR